MANDQPSTSTTQTKKIVINADDGDKNDKKKKKGTPINRQTIIKFLIIGLTLFYGQLLANVFYNNFVEGIPELVVDPSSAFAILKVVIGVLILVVAIFSLITVYLKKWILIFISACLLIAISIVALVLTITDLVMRKERGQTVGKDFASGVAEVIIESILRIAAISVEFFMIHLLKQEYQAVPTSA